ncbi:HAD family hydrolase [Limosilactobacillus sp. STM2_1]|uniref:HAD family hydrolase n=1 Tax=Limosilactobacillus rudii TaxID=2759755 RepID=A0A7W3UKS0_9LACO|nr:HAD family hydrolase [Limosilactobacillus rudii]MBB1079240.1 HAD family hydrolase [Limosilactobacillus rudii]MBB1097329.1 HAD family hydrolase [Limosilactobacillus rudii]MCD7134438.1 HAD family hydrolase [Limosilactobacillus rudii]
MTIKNFIFDIDGTLIDTFQMYMPALLETLENHGYHFSDPAGIEKQLYGIAAVDALHKLGVPADDISALDREWIQKAYQKVDQVKVLPGIPAVLKNLASRTQTRMAIVTSKTREEYKKYFQDKYDFAKYFSIAVTANDTEKHKPAPDPLLLAMRQLNAKAEEVVYVGDMQTDLSAAKMAGIKFAGANYGSVFPEKLVNADFKLVTPADLLKI